MKKIFLFCLLLHHITGYSQFNFSLSTDVTVMEENKLLAEPWSGGLNAPQYNTLDFDFDGDQDLVLYDRFAQKILTFAWDGNRYLYTPEYETLFPEGVSNWLLLRDFNCDNKKDIFTGDVLGIRVFLNTSTDEELSWKPYYFTTGTAQSEVLLTKGLSGLINLQLQFDDLPSISDVDGDGDIDIFNIVYGGSTIEFHENLGNCDAPDFQLVTQEWGNVAECDCAVFKFNGEKCPTSGGRTKHSGGKSLLALDVDGNNELDMLLSEAECDKLSLFPNEGTIASPVINRSSLFPGSSPANFILFPTPYYEDLDNDGIRDLIVTPNVFSKSDPMIDLRKSGWFYKNEGTDSNPSFTLIQKDFLQDKMIDSGDNTVPALADEDGDGDLDLFISANKFPSSVWFYRNTGTKESPAFQLENRDYLGLSSKDLSGLKIYLADINNDRAIDFVYAATLTTGFSELNVMVNKSATRLDFSGQSFTKIIFSITSNENISFVQVDNDGFTDILKGRINGSLEFWKNAGNLSFSLVNGQYLGIGPNVFQSSLSCTSADLNADGKPDLVIGDQTGKLRIVSDFRNAVDAATSAVDDIIFNTRTSEYDSPNLGGRLWPIAANIFNRNIPSLLIGTSLGGLRLLEAGESSTIEMEVAFYPNPVHKSENFMVKVNRGSEIEIYSTTGQFIRSVQVPASVYTPIGLEKFPAGMYLLKIHSGNKSQVHRVVVY